MYCIEIFDWKLFGIRRFLPFILKKLFSFYISAATLSFRDICKKRLLL